MRFQESILNLGVAVEEPAPGGSPEISAEALIEARELKILIEAHDRESRST